MVDLPATSVLCPGSGIPTDIVDEVTGNVRWSMYGICGAAMTELPLATAHPARLASSSISWEVNRRLPPATRQPGGSTLPTRRIPGRVLEEADPRASSAL